MLTPFAVLITLATAQTPEPVIQRFGNSFTESATLVDHAALAHTSQLIASDDQSSTRSDEIQSVFAQLSSLLSDFDSSPDDLVQLNFYVADEKVAADGLKFLATWTAMDSRPAVSLVTTRLPLHRQFAIDAVFVARKSTGETKVIHQASLKGNTVASLLPKGDVVYISGQAQAGDLATATRATLSGLESTLTHLNLSRSDIVRIKCFLQPMADVTTVNREIIAFFDNTPIPVVSHVEWIVGGSRPIEIEIVAAAPMTDTTETVSYLTPPEMKSSPVFSRVVRIHGNRRIYAAGLVSTHDGDGAEQVHSIFQQLIQNLKPARSNLRHLVKATYYVSSSEASTQLNKLRPHYYDPQRPPAASKAMVRGVGQANREISIDMIAAPEAPLNRVLVPIAEKLKPTRTVIYKTIGNRELHLHIFEPKGHQATDRRPVILAIHGGGWTGGNAQSFFPFAAHFVEGGVVGMSVEYRLKSNQNGTTVFDCVRDVRSAIRWIRRNSKSWGIDEKRIVALGGSAGGHLAASAALFDEFNEDDDDLNISARPDYLILMNPVIDTSSQGYGQAKIGERWRELSPVHNVKSGLPPTLIFHGTADAVTPYVGAREFHERSIGKGNSSKLVTHSGGRHGYIIFDIAEFNNAMNTMSAFLEEHQILGEN